MPSHNLFGISAHSSSNATVIFFVNLVFQNSRKNLWVLKLVNKVKIQLLLFFKQSVLKINIR